MAENLQQGFRLGEFVIHPLRGTASGPDGVHHVPPMAMEVLLCLAKAPGTVVTRQALLSEVWGDQSGSDEALTHCISELRHKLGDHRELPTYIQTLPKRGYRLVAAVSDLPTIDSSATARAARNASSSSTPEAQSAATSPRGIKGFVEDLQRRRVFRVALVYVICAWLIIQVSEATFPALLIPPWAQTLVVVLTIIGFPIALILAWAFQITPEGVTSDVSPSYFRTVGDRRKIDYIVIAALVAIIVFLAFRQFLNEETELSPSSPELALGDHGSIGVPVEQVESIAVLPFLNMSDDSGNEYFSDGLSEEILNSLTRLRELKVAARTSSFYFKNKDVDLPTIGLHLGVRHVLEGSVRRQGQQVRVTAQLIRADTGFHTWSETYDREVKDVFGIQSDIARNVAQALELVLSSESGARLDRRATASLDAYEYYLQARGYLRNPLNESTLTSAETLFEKALAIDVDYAEAHAGLCDTYLSGYERSRSTELFEKAERACHRALTLDSSAGDVYTALGNLYRNSGQYHKAEQGFERAITLNASAGDAYDGLAQTYKEQNRLDEAESAFRRAIEIQPRFWRGHLAMGNFLFSAGRWAEASEYFRRVTDLTPDNSVGYLNLGATYYMLGDYENAAIAWRHSADLSPSQSAYANIGSSYFFLGRFQEAIEMYQRATELAPDDYEAWGDLGDACRFAEGRTELATSAYKKAIELAENVLRLNPSDANATALLAHYYANLGESERARQLVARALKLSPQSMYVCYDAAVTNVSLGEADEALAAIERAVELGYPVELLSVDAGLAPLMETDRFRALIAKRED
jgi:TolB-like protein/Flp pilus assembly protein TadD/DNA-binding winged helix-turn-helix (wHTH) protein